MNTRIRIFTLCALIWGVLSAWAQGNTLTIPDVTVAPGRSVYLPIQMNNTSNVVGVQFTLTVQNGITLDTSTATLTERADGHTMKFSKTGTNQYMAVIFSPENKPFIGRAGDLITVKLTASASLEEGFVSPMTLSEVVLGAPDGSNICTGHQAGRVLCAKSPDLEVSNVSFSGNTLSPQGTLSLNWQVSNIGGIATGPGWSEHILLETAEGIAKELGTVYYDQSLNTGGVVSRNADINVPFVLGIDGDAYIRVRLVPNRDTGETEGLQHNNSAFTSSAIRVEKALKVSPENAEVDEAEEPLVKFLLTRSGDTSKEESFTIAKNNDSRIQLPESVTIPAGQSGVVFYAQIKANNIMDGDSDVTINISGTDYGQVSAQLSIDDDILPNLGIESDAQDVEEGQAIKFRITTERASSNDIALALTCDLPKRFDIPSDIKIPAGETEVEVTVTAKDDDVPNVEEVVTFTVTAARHNPASMNTVLTDNDVPTLQLEITPSAISESAGPLAITAKLKRTDNIDKVVTVKLSDDSEGNLYYGRQSIVMEKGVEEVTLNLGPLDNSIVDGERTYNISAAVWIASCSCNANNGTSGGVVTVPLTIYDNDGPTLSMTSAASVLKEGGEMMITVTRNADIANPLAVNIESNYDADLVYPSTITIQSGEASVSFVVTSKGNEITENGVTALLSAKAEGFATGNVWFAISDQTLPDAQITALKPLVKEYFYNDEIGFCIQIANTGNAELPSNALIQLYKSDNSVVAEYYTQSAIPAGVSVDLNMTFKPSLSIGRNSFYAIINPEKKAKELNYANNTSSFADIQILSPFTTTTKVAKTILGKNEEIQISGKATGRQIANAEIDVYVINRGYRHVITTKTDAEGSFTAKYKPYENQSGHFSVGACFHGEQLNVEQCYFDIYAIDVKNSSPTCDIANGDSFTGKFYLSNNGILPLNNVKASLVSEITNAEVTISETPINIAGGETKEVSYTIKGLTVSPSLEWQTAKVTFVCDEGATATSAINYYIREPKAQLKADVVSINTSVTIGNERKFYITLSNLGKSETGKISFVTPSWIRVEGAQTLQSMTMGETTEVALVISTTDHMQANVPVTGNIAINCDNGNGITIPFNIEPVSSATGFLSIDVCDEFTYYTSDSPHVAGASIEVKHPTTGKVIIAGTTNEQGLFNVELPEGYYTITVNAYKHETYTNNIYVDPERTRNVVVNIGYTAITYNWNVEETEVEDEYKLVTKVNYETNVPLPVVVIGLPEKIDGDNMKAGESTIINVTVTNKGLLPALNNTITLPKDTEEWLFESLVSIEPFDLPSQQSIVIPVRITRLIDYTENQRMAKSVATDMMDNFSNCMFHIKDTYEAVCGDTLRNNESIERMAMKMCGIAATGATIFNYLSNLYYAGIGSGVSSSLGKPAGGQNKSGTSTTQHTTLSEQSFSMCNPCDAKKAEDLFEVIIGKTYLGGINDGMNESIKILKDPNYQEKQRLVVTAAGLEALRESLQEAAKAYAERRTGLNVSDIWDFGEALWDIIQVTRISSTPCQNQTPGSPMKTKESKDDSRSWQAKYNEVAAQEADYLENFYSILFELFGDTTWFGNDFENKLSYAVNLTEKENLSIDEILESRPASITSEQAITLYNRLNGLDATNTIDASKLEELVEKNMEMDEIAVAEGFESLADRFVNAYDICAKMYQEESSSVCASITLQFSQQMVMTRQAFRGTLTVFNGNETTAMTDVKLTLEVKDADGNLATSHEFQINPESLTGFEGQLDLGDGWTLGANETGVATILFIPTKYAAPMVEKPYSFGGTLSYVDPFTGLTVTRTLAPVVLTVKPSPNLDLTYFMQRDIKGDDPLTEAIEPCEEAEFSLLINNTGYGDATDVRMYTEQPQIIENEKGLLIDFELMSSQLNGGEKTLALGGTVATDFGTIPAKSTAYAQWWIRSSLLGHFTDYNIEATHVTSYGNPDLSLLNEVTIHELIRSIDANETDTKVIGFLANDIVDAEDTPDMLYLSNGEVEKVFQAQTADIQKISDTDYMLKVIADKSGWNYGNITDPTYGVSTLKRVVRQRDGKDMSLRNFWQTDCTLRDGKDPLYENRIHFADDMDAANNETYILTFEPVPELILEVASFENVPEEGSLSTEPLEHVKVIFNKTVNPSTFSSEDISLAVQGVKQDISSIGISTDDNKTFTLDLTGINETIGNGYFVLTVNTSGITDSEGFLGKNGKQTGWIMFRDGLVELNSETYPKSAGTIQKQTVPSRAVAQASTEQIEDKATYGSTIRLTTIPNEGYIFKNWTINGEIVSTEKELEYVALNDMDIKANYSLKTYAVNIAESDDGGTISGAASGVYSYGDVLKLAATAHEDFVFDGWMVNGKLLGHDNEQSVVVDEVKDIKAIFRREIFHQALIMERGWNWISTFVNDTIPINELPFSVTHIISQFDETIDDPVYGMTGGIDMLLPGVAYKMKTAYSVMKSFKGHLYNLTDAPIELHSGWNWISYPYVEERNLNEVLVNASEGDYITSQLGFAEYMDGNWEGTLTDFTPGCGYIYKSGEDKVLEFDFTQTTSEATAMRASATGYDISDSEIDVHKYPSTMNIIAQVTATPYDIDDSQCCIYAFAGNECRGKSKYIGGKHYLTVYGDDATGITFVIENTSNGNTYIANESLNFRQDVIGSRKSPFILTLSGPTDINSINGEGHRLKIYTPDGRLVGTDATAEALKTLRHGIYIINGQKFMVK